MIKALIVDDESRARRILKTLIEENFNSVTIVGEAEDVPSAVKAIHAYKPNLVFLDVEMPGFSGFELFDFLPKPIDFEVVFATAYSQYAIKAFEVSAVGYLLKPIKFEELEKVIERVSKKTEFQSNQNISVLHDNFKSGTFKKIALPNSNGIAFENIENIVYLKADGSYTHFVFNNREPIIVSKKIKEFENILNSENGFFRTHRSFIININFVKEYIKTEGGFILMQNGDEISLSREMKNDFLSLMGIQS